VAIDLQAALGLAPPVSLVPEETEVDRARRELAALRAERARRTSAVAPEPAHEEPEEPAEPEESEELDEVAPILPEEVVAERCRRSLHRYVREQWAHCGLTAAVPFEDGEHIKAICDHIQGQLEDAAAKKRDLRVVMRAQNLLVNTPPRSLKSITLTFANAWAWIRWPSMQILYVSITPTVVLTSARLFRDAVTSAWYQRLFVRGAWKLREDQDALGSMGNTLGGVRQSKGADARIVGANSEWLCIDDAHQLDDTAEMIKAFNENYDVNLSSRMNDPRTGIRTAIMQRAARGDFSEHVLAQGWFHLRMPLEFEWHTDCPCKQCAQGMKGEPNAFGWVDWRTTDGEVMHPRFTREYIEDAMRRLRHSYAGVMQQRPSSKEGNQFKIALWQYAKIEDLDLPYPRPNGASAAPPHILKRKQPTDGAPGRLDVDWVCLTVDVTGGSTNKKSSALGLVGMCGKAERRILLGDYTPGPTAWMQTMRAVQLALTSLANLTAWQDRIRVLVEKKALGEAAMGQLREAIADGKITDRWGRTVIAAVEPYEPTGKGDKEQRAAVMEPLFESGLMLLLDGAEWLTIAPRGPATGGNITTLVDEFAAFPRAPRDDRVDCVSQAVDRYTKRQSDWVRFFTP